MSPPSGDLVVRRIGRLLPMTAPLIQNAALVARAGRVAWIGPDRALPTDLGQLPEVDAGGAAVIPGFVDCHTHLVWAGSRREEFAARLAGQPYDGGGIATTVAATREAGNAELAALTAARAAAALAAGTTTMEVKTGYGLSPEHELRLLDVIAAVADRTPQRIEATYLGAHSIPVGRERRDYVEEVVATLPTAAEHGARWCDVFCDRGAFTVAEARRVLDAAKESGLGLRCHADQIDRIGAVPLAAGLGCASADHLDHVDEAGARALAQAGTVAVLLPTATLTLRTGGWGSAAILQDAGATIALATDCNPGTSWTESMPYVLQIACLQLGLSVPEALRAATLHSAWALRRNDVGHLGVGAAADLVVLHAAHEVDLVAHLGAPAVNRVAVGGMWAGSGAVS
ncbi:MAG: imidazolonepropionase [Frankiaceae bacterium]